MKWLYPPTLPSICMSGQLEFSNVWLTKCAFHDVNKSRVKHFSYFSVWAVLSVPWSVLAGLFCRSSLLIESRIVVINLSSMSLTWRLVHCSSRVSSWRRWRKYVTWESYSTVYLEWMHTLRMQCEPSCFYQLRQLRSVRRSLTLDARRTLAAAFISSRVDYWNAVFYGVSSQVDCRWCWMPLPAWLLVLTSTTTSHRPCATSSTGYQCRSECCLRCHLLPLILSMAQVPRTLRTSVFRCLTSQVAPIFVRLGVVICSFPEQELCSADGVFELQRHSSGTVCLGICALWPSVVNNSELGWKLIFSARFTQRTSEKFRFEESINWTELYLL